MKNALSDDAYSISFKTFVNEKFLPYYANKVSPQTYKDRLSMINNHYKAFEEMNIADIDKNDVDEWYQAMLTARRKQGKQTDGNVHGIKGLLKLIFDYAVEKEFCSFNPVTAVKNIKKTKRKRPFWELAHYKKVCKTFELADFKQHSLFISIMLMFMTGLRISEASALTWDDINFDTKKLDVNKSLRYDNASNYDPESTTKTESANRILTLDTNTINLLKEWKERQQKQINTNLVLTTNGIPMHNRAVNRALEKHAELAGVHRITPHGLRHSHASLLVHLNEDLLIIKDRLGHSDVKTTLGEYGHLYSNRDVELAGRLNNIVDYNLED